MKRKAPIPRSGSKVDDVKRDLSQPQLASIGAIAIAFNELEFLLEAFLYTALGLPGQLWFDVVKRISSIEAKTDIAKLAIDDLERLLVLVFERPDLSFATDAKTTIGLISETKVLRDMVVHCRVYDAPNAIGEKGSYKGVMDQVLLTLDALGWLYDRIDSARKELLAIYNFFDLIRSSFEYGPFGPTKLRPAQEAHECLDRLRSLQKTRQSLGPPPKFLN
ncbi:MAG: hypothetical protein ACTHPD_05445 [Rhizomicrobium sp.]